MQPARCAAAQTAEAAGLTVDAVEPAHRRVRLRRVGRAHAGRAVASRPEARGAWMTDPDAAPHGGESLRAFAARVGGLARRAGGAPTARAVAITHGGVVKAAVVHALGAPLEAFWRVDVAPLVA